MNEDKELEFFAEWTLKTTKSRRKEWNEMVRSDVFITNADVDWAKVHAQFKKQGWNADSLMKAVKNYNL